METLDTILGAINSSGLELYLKAILVVLVIVVGVWKFFQGRAARDEQAQNNQAQDQQQNIPNNTSTEQQHARDAQSVRDRLRGKKP